MELAHPAFNLILGNTDINLTWNGGGFFSYQLSVISYQWDLSGRVFQLSVISYHIMSVGIVFVKVWERGTISKAFPSSYFLLLTSFFLLS